MKTIVLLSLLIALPAYAGPFGLEMGMTKEQVEAKVGRPTDSRGAAHHYKTVPLPNRAFSSYMLRFSKRSGLCKVLAIGETVEANRTGAQVRSTFNDVLTALTVKYGAPVKVWDFVHSGALYDGDDEFMWAIYKKERTLAAYWGNGDSELPGDLKTILIEVSGLSPAKGYITVVYDLKNVDDCRVESEQADRASL